MWGPSAASSLPPAAGALQDAAEGIFLQVFDHPKSSQTFKKRSERLAPKRSKTPRRLEGFYLASSAELVLTAALAPSQVTLVTLVTSAGMLRWCLASLRSGLLFQSRA